MKGAPGAGYGPLAAKKLSCPLSRFSEQGCFGCERPRPGSSCPELICKR